MDVPGHKQGRGLDPQTVQELGIESFVADITSLNGIDDRNESWGVQTSAEELAAALFGADQSFFLVNGSSLSMHVAVCSVVSPGEEIVVARNVHKSVIGALIISGAQPIFLQPELDDELEIAHTPTPDALRAALSAHPQAKAAVVVSPSYYGVAADIRGLAEACHERDLPLVMDDAWGAHFAFHPDFPEASIKAGSDIAVASIQKTLNGLQQASILSIQGPRVDPTIVSYRVGLLETTSTSSVILASIDATRRLLALRGEELYTRRLQVVRAALRRDRCAAGPGRARPGRRRTAGRLRP
jgi:arginine decarboxylase